jgi:lipoprotein-releasing system permease protein
LEERPLDFNSEVYNHYQDFGYITHIQEYAHKPGLIKNEDDVLGVVVKGVGKSYDTLTFNKNLIQGRFIHFPDSVYANEVVLSRLIADKANVNIGDDIIIHFFQNPPRFRRLAVVGIYETNLSEYFDGKIILSDIRMIARLNEWADSVAGGLEVFVSDMDHLDDVGYALAESIDFDENVESVDYKYMQIFQWLNLLKRQVNILLTIILTVVCVNMISVILILAMERTQMIGILKALGATNRLIRSIFVYNGVRLIVKGLLVGNIIGLGLCFVQDKFQLITLNPKDYYVSFVPISWEWDIILVLNMLTLAVVTVVLLLPTSIVSRVNPIKAIRFD